MLLALLACLTTTAAAQPLPYPTTSVSSDPPVVLQPSAPITYEQLIAPEAGEVSVVAPTTPAPAPEAVASPEVVATPTDDMVADSSMAAGPMLESEPEVHWYQPTYWFGPAPWDSGFELGLNGAGGTSESISFRTGGFVKREGDDYKFDSSLYYNKTQSEGVEIQSNALLDVRYDWLFGDSPWTLFVMSQTFYDEFQAFDVNFNANSGVGYRWLNEDWTKLTTSIGTGSSREFGGLRDEWVAEASFGLKYEVNFTETKKFYSKVDYFPEWEEFGRYRVLADVGLEIELNQPSNVSLKFSATDRYDSDPEGVEPHNLNYSALLIWKL